jgi:hypothetical protein
MTRGCDLAGGRTAQGVGAGLFARRGKAPRLSVYPKPLRVVFPLSRWNFGRVVGAGSRPQLYVGGQKKNQAVIATEMRAAVKLPLTVLLATRLTVREAPVVAIAASVAKITNARASSRQIKSIMAIP